MIAGAVIDKGNIMSPEKYREKVIRECIEVVKGYGKEFGWLEALESLLPKPDKAKELVEAYSQTFQKPDVAACHMDDELEFARWLIESGKL